MPKWQNLTNKNTAEL